MYIFNPAYPTEAHASAAQWIREWFQRVPEAQAVLLTCSCARGKATPDSCLDICVLIPPATSPESRSRLWQDWVEIDRSEQVFINLRKVGKYSQVDLSFSDGSFQPGYHGWTSGPDEFELEIGNTLVYSVPLWERNRMYQDLRARWLPYYAEKLRIERLEMVTKYGFNNLDHIPGYAGRGLYFQCFQRFYHAFGEFLQALFISRKIYPIAYDKWVREQVVEILDLPDLYPELPRLFEIQHFESDEITHKAARLRNLWEQFIRG